MAKIKISRSVLAKASERSILNAEERVQLVDTVGEQESKKGSVSTDLVKLPMPSSGLCWTTLA